MNTTQFNRRAPNVPGNRPSCFDSGVTGFTLHNVQSWNSPMKQPSIPPQSLHLLSLGRFTGRSKPKSGRILLVLLVCLGQVMASRGRATTLDESLVAAAAKGRTSEAEDVLARGADPNAKDVEKTPALILA